MKKERKLKETQPVTCEVEPSTSRFRLYLDQDYVSLNLPCLHYIGNQMKEGSINLQYIELGC